MSAARRVATAVVAVTILLPLGLTCAAVFVALWLAAVVTFVGPAAAAFGTRRDAATLARVVSPPTPGAPVELVAVDGGGRRLAVRWTPAPPGSALPPVAIPNGLGATLVSVGRLHDALAARGFPVLSYDRAGVGMSDPLPSGARHFDAAATVADMRAVLTRCHPGGGAGPWVLVGPSMGSIVSQAYLAAHGDAPDDDPGAVAGLLNLDGFPFPFAAKRPRFEASARVYAVVAAVVPTGVLRPLLAAAPLGAIATPAFRAPVVRAQMNGANFFASLRREMRTMLDCADAARAGWGPAFDLAALPAPALAPLVAAAPAACGDVAPADAAGAASSATAAVAAAAGADAAAAASGGVGGDGVPLAPAGGWTELPRSAWERGADWADPADTRAAVAAMLAADAAGGAPAPLPRNFRRLVVRCMSARSYAFPGGERFYDDEMKDWAAAEHALHASLAADGARTVFPSHTHGDLFFATVEYAAAQVAEIAAALAARRGGAAPPAAAPAASRAAAVSGGA